MRKRRQTVEDLSTHPSSRIGWKLIMASTSEILQRLNEAKDLAFSSRENFPQVLRHIFNFVGNPDVEIQKWCSSFLLESFKVDETKLTLANKIELAIDSIDSLIILLNVKDLIIFQNAIDTSVIVFKLAFKYIAENDGCQNYWTKLTELKLNLIQKFKTNFPYKSSFNEEFNQVKNLHSKLELIKFIVVVIDYQTKSSSNVKSFSLARVNPQHSLLKSSLLENESVQLLDLLLQPFQLDIIIAPLLTAILNHIVLLVKRKPQLVNNILNTIENYESNNKLQSNYQTLENYKLSKKYIDRTLRIFINHLLRNQLIPANYQSGMNKKLSTLIARGDDIRKKNILAENPEVDSRIKKRKFDGFENSSTKILKVDYKNLYCLNDPSNELNNFNLNTLPQNVLISMTLTALNKMNAKKLSSALKIIGERYSNVIKDTPPDQLIDKTQDDAYEVKRLGQEDDDDEYDDDDKVGLNYNPQTVFTLPPARPLSFQEKKSNINLIIKNFFKLAEKDIVDIDEKVDLKSEILKEENGEEINKELTKVAIKTWKKNSWLILLTRLATRGMTSGFTDVEQDAVEDKNQELSDLIRTAIFDYFLDNIHTRIDLIIEWLNEEWYSEKVFNEEKEMKTKSEEVYQQYEAASDKNSFNLQEKLAGISESLVVDTPTYNKWAGKVLDAMIPFLEPNDRKIFIRLLSDLPYLNDDLVARIKSLCFDPVRIKIGFLSLQFLIMYRPPVKEACINILKELSESDQQDLKDESNKLLAKYT